MTKGELARYIKDLECKYSEFVATKFANGLSLGNCNLECLEQKAFLAKETIKVLQRFYEDGKTCDSCDIEIGSWRITSICGYLDAPYTTYECLYSFTAGVSPDKYVNSIFTFNEDGTFIIVLQDATVINGDYTYDSSTGIILITTGNFFSPITLTFSSDCSEMTMTYDNPLNDQSAIVTLTPTLVQSQDCDWQEYCITEEEALDMYKKTKQILGTRCNCN